MSADDDETVAYQIPIDDALFARLVAAGWLKPEVSWVPTKAMMDAIEATADRMLAESEEE